MMQKLHILAEIGHSFVTLTNHNGLSSLHAPGKIFLPSSLYKVSISYKSDEQFLTRFGILFFIFWLEEI